MRILQLTDLHIGRPGEDSHGVDVRANFLKLLENIPRYQPDEIMISGDLCLREPDPEVYRWVRAQLEPLQIPVKVISGNHDEAQLLAAHFNLADELHRGELYYYRDDTPMPVIHLDTTSKVISAVQLAWLSNRLSESKGPVLLFMHHPPMLSGVPYMDKNHALCNREEVQEVLTAYQAPVYIFCGHYHVDKMLAFHNLFVHITPSAYFQIDQFEEDFAVDHYRIAMRIIDFNSDRLGSSIVYLNGFSL